MFRNAYFLLLGLCFLFAACSNKGDFDLSREEFIELFHALEIEGIDSLKVTLPIFRESDTVRYADYIIQKYRLWDPVYMRKLLKVYKDKKNFFYSQEEKWHQVLLAGQSFHKNGLWKELLVDFQKDNQESMLNFLKKEYPSLSQVIVSFMKRDTAMAESLYPKFQISIADVEDLFKRTASEIDARVEIVLRVFSRQLFKEAFQKMDVNV